MKFSRAMKNKSKQIKRPLADKSPKRLKRLKALSGYLHGALPNFMPPEKLRKMREEWDSHKNQNRLKFR